MHQRLVAGVVAVGVVELLEIIDVQHGQTHRSFLAPGAADLALQRFFHALAVERAGQSVVANHVAGLFELGVQARHLLFGLVHPGPHFHQFVARTLGGQLHGAGFVHHHVEHVGKLGDVVGLADLVGTDTNPVVVFTGGGGKVGQPVDEVRQHVLQPVLRVAEILLERALLIDQVLEASLDVVDLSQAERLADQIPHHRNLAAHPLIVDNQLADVLDDQLQQVEQGRAQLHLVFGDELQPVAEFLQLGGKAGDLLGGGGGADVSGQTGRFLGQFGGVDQQRAECIVEQLGQQFLQIGIHRRRWSGRLRHARGRTGRVHQAAFRRTALGPVSGQRLQAGK